MKHFVNVLLLTLFVIGASISQSKYFRGNTHTHCYPWSGDIKDSTYTADVVVDAYKKLKYDFIVFTNHGTWADFTGHSTAEFTVINGSEVGISRNGRWGHFSALGLDSRISGAGLTHQQLIDSISAHGAIPFLNHPRFSLIPLTAAHVLDSMKQGLGHMEIWNATTTSQPPPDDISVWDSVLSTGRLMYGIACDDSHKPSHRGKAWIMVRAKSNHTDDLLAGIRRGDFYSSTGVILESIESTQERISVVSENRSVVRFVGRHGTTLATVEGKVATYRITGTEGYVRAEVQNEKGERAWTQPVLISIRN